MAATNQQQEPQPLVPYPSNNTIINGSSISNNNNVGDDYFPPGYRFCPTDVELVQEYLKKKIMNLPLPCPEIMQNVIREANLYNFNAEEFLARHKKPGETEWYFFTTRDRKYTNGKRPRRDAGNGYWKATGVEKKIYSNNVHVGSKYSLVFHIGKSPKGKKTNWLMHEFRLQGYAREKTSPDDNMLDLVLCKVYQKPKKNKETVQPQGQEANGRLENSAVSSDSESTNELNNSGISNSMVASEYGNYEDINHVPRASRLGNSPHFFNTAPIGKNAPSYHCELPLSQPNMMQQQPSMLLRTSNFNSLPMANAVMNRNELISNGGFSNLMVGGNGFHNSVFQMPMPNSFSANGPGIFGAASPLVGYGQQPMMCGYQSGMYTATSNSNMTNQLEDSFLAALQQPGVQFQPNNLGNIAEPNNMGNISTDQVDGEISWIMQQNFYSNEIPDLGFFDGLEDDFLLQSPPKDA